MDSIDDVGIVAIWQTASTMVGKKIKIKMFVSVFYISHSTYGVDRHHEYEHHTPREKANNSCSKQLIRCRRKKIET